MPSILGPGVKMGCWVGTR